MDPASSDKNVLLKNRSGCPWLLPASIRCLLVTLHNLTDLSTEALPDFVSECCMEASEEARGIAAKEG